MKFSSFRIPRFVKPFVKRIHMLVEGTHGPEIVFPPLCFVRSVIIKIVEELLCECNVLSHGAHVEVEHIDEDTLIGSVVVFAADGTFHLLDKTEGIEPPHDLRDESFAPVQPSGDLAKGEGLTAGEKKPDQKTIEALESV